MARLGTSSSGGVVSIQGTDGSPITTTGGAINVAVSAPNLVQYSETDNIAIGSSSDVLSYTVPPGNSLSLGRVMVSATSVSSFQCMIDGSAVGVVRLGYAGTYNETFIFDGYALAAGTTLLIRATNFSQNDLATFNVTMIGSLT